MENEAASLSGQSGEALCSDLRRLIQEMAPACDPKSVSVSFIDRATVPLQLTLQYSVGFDASVSEVAGPIPNGIQVMESSGSLKTLLEQRLQLARQEAGDLIDGWISQYAHDYRNAPPPDICLNPRPALALQEVCSKCGGATRVACPGCGGAKSVTCHGCGSAGKTTCASCGGSGRKTCLTCGGSGTVEKREFEMSYMDAQNTMNQREVIRRVPCGACNGGSNPCSCGDGKTTCTTCGGGGWLNCSTCGASGTVPCDRCAATGHVHQKGQISCSVSRDVHRQVGGDNAEDSRTLSELVPLEQLGDLAQVRLERAQRKGHTVTLLYSANTDVQTACVVVGGDAISIRAYGPARKIYDHHAWLERVLTPDLSSLEHHTHGSLVDSVKRFLAADINATLAENPSEGVPAAASVASYSASNLVSDAYIRRASTALDTAAPKLYGSLARARGVIFAAASTGALILSHSAHLAGWMPRYSPEFAALAACGLWALVEWEARKTLQGSLGPTFYRALNSRLESPREKYRWLAGGWVAASWYLTGVFFYTALIRRAGSLSLAAQQTAIQDISAFQIQTTLVVRAATALAVYRLSKKFGYTKGKTVIFTVLAALPDLWVISVIAIIYKAVSTGAVFRRRPTSHEGAH